MVLLPHHVELAVLAELRQRVRRVTVRRAQHRLFGLAVGGDVAVDAVGDAADDHRLHRLSGVCEILVPIDAVRGRRDIDDSTALERDRVEVLAGIENVRADSNKRSRVVVVVVVTIPVRVEIALDRVPARPCVAAVGGDRRDDGVAPNQLLHRMHVHDLVAVAAEDDARVAARAERVRGQRDRLLRPGRAAVG